MFKKLFLTLALMLTGPWLGAQTWDVRTHTLRNGMKILVREDHTIPNVAFYLFYRIGSRNEQPGTTGLSHFFEHMMFNTAASARTPQFDQAIEAAGGASNAYTDYDVTVYQNRVPASALPLVFALESNRLAHLSFDPRRVESERGVVASERRAVVEDDPLELLREQLWAAAFTAHPYQWPVIGWMADIEHWRMADLNRHFAMGYSPANATLVVCGDVKFATVIQLAQRWLGPIKSRERPRPITTREPEQQGERRTKVVKPAQLPALMVGYHVPESAHADFYPLQVLRGILLVGRSSRLYQRLVDRESLAIAVEGEMDLALDPTLFVITVQAKAGADTLTIEQVLYAELDRVKTEGVTERELRKAKNILRAEFHRQLKTIDGKSQALGNYEIFFGDYRQLYGAAEAFGQVTRDDVIRVANRYFTENNRTVATLVPATNAPNVRDRQPSP
jgi:zinc protease